MKYINADALLAALKAKHAKYTQRGEQSDAARDGKAMYWGGVLSCLNEIITTVEEMEQEGNTPPAIEEESRREGWLDYGLAIGEIGLHRYNAIRRIREHKDTFTPQNDIPSGIIYHVAEYYKAVGAELTLCCLQRWCMDFRFDADDVKEIIREEERGKEAHR